ncbi:N-acetylneuraminate lyase-like [Spodoptera frugiperda]|uniref:N-acetylneuraminate lyase n=1 Tax=Spodoptera frugiperda TaxID=7108 RepID=A0A9R0EPU1_SPOFR|nr:N-acetylneuraminate lyase-like [Spodoptera frugiperda]
MERLSHFVLIFCVFCQSLEALKMCSNIGGIIAPVFTPVDSDGVVNLSVIPQYAQYLQDQGVDGILVAGTAGEGPTVNVTDMKHLIDAWINVSKSLNLSVIIQLGGRPLPDVQKLAAYSEQAGADAIMTLPELYYKPTTARQLVYFMQEVARYAPETPILYYHIPSYTDVDGLDMVEFWRLATQRIPTFLGIKSAVFETSLMLQDKVKDDQKIFIADSLYLAPAVLMGFRDIIMIEINLFPTLVEEVVSNGSRGYTKTAISKYRRMRELRSIITKEGGSISALKEAMPLVSGIDVGSIRPPEIRLTTDQVIRLEQRIRNADVDIVNSEFQD